MLPYTSFTLLYFFACALFLLGASFSYRSTAGPRAVALMLCAVMLGSTVSFIPIREAGLSRVGLYSQSLFFTGSLLLEIITVWLLFPAALLVWIRRRIQTFHRMVLVAEIGWCAAVMLMLYGLYWQPAG